MACTAITMVKLLESRQKVMTLEKMMLGEKMNGLGQSGVESRRYVYAINRAEKVSASEMMNSHIPNFFDPIEYGRVPPCQTESTATASASDIRALPPEEK